MTDGLRPSTPVRYPGFEGRVAVAHLPEDPSIELPRVLDPGAAEETIHWGRNYLYRATLRTATGPLPVVVKQFRHQTAKARLRRRRAGSKAARSWRMAHAFLAAGVPTPEPVALVESTRIDGPTFFVCRHLADTVEARYLLRARNGGTFDEDFPEVDFAAFLRDLGRLLRRMHDAGLFHRDLSIGNVLLQRGGPDAGALFLLDLNRARLGGPLGTWTRSRDLCRLALHRADDRRTFLAAYWDGASAVQRAVYFVQRWSFLTKIETKRRLRGGPWRSLRDGLRQWILPRSHHVHIPDADPGASVRDRAVWDHLSDQPHQHASRAQKLRIRLADAPSHLRQAGALVGATPRILRRYRELRADLYREPSPWEGPGICVRPHPADPDALLDAIDDLGLRHVLLRLQPWEGRYDDEEALARELVAGGHEVVFAIPQTRELVRDPPRWRAELETIAERFIPYGRHFQIGQAVNRSKWGIWTMSEWTELVTAAEEVFRGRTGTAGPVELLGPTVIDFELQTTAALVNLRHAPFHFDVLASLLYVDRRGAPENPQLGFDTVGKVTLAKAIADTGRLCGGRSWITEVNWPLWEGPHSPAGKGVSVDEATQADYLTRFYLLALGTGYAERVYWWQLVARGYGLVAPEIGSHGETGGLRRRPAFAALCTLAQELEGTAFQGPLPSPDGVHLYPFRKPDGTDVVAAWAHDADVDTVRLPRETVRLVLQDGREVSPPDGVEIEVGASVRYATLR